KPDGATVTVKITDKTEYRKERQSAKLEDFKVGDVVFVRGQENADHTVTAQVIGGAAGGVIGGRGVGELGKDFAVAEVKSIEAPKLTILRPDNVTQTLELNEDTSLRRGRDSITMADIQPGDHVFVRGAVANDVFVPKNVMVIPPEQWNRMQEVMNDAGEKRGSAPHNPPAPPTPPAPPAAPPPEQRN